MSEENNNEHTGTLTREYVGLNGEKTVERMEAPNPSCTPVSAQPFAVDKTREGSYSPSR